MIIGGSDRASKWSRNSALRAAWPATNWAPTTAEPDIAAMTLGPGRRHPNGVTARSCQKATTRQAAGTRPGPSSVR